MQRNYCVDLLRQKKKYFFESLNLVSVTLYKLFLENYVSFAFWKTFFRILKVFCKNFGNSQPFSSNVFNIFNI